jgi:hypothetical protein
LQLPQAVARLVRCASRTFLVVSMNPLIVNVRNAKGGFVYVGRAMHARGLAESPYANPFPITKTETRRKVLLDYIEHFIAQVSANNTDFRPEVLSRLAGKRLGCGCARACACAQGGR